MELEFYFAEKLFKIEFRKLFLFLLAMLIITPCIIPFVFIKFKALMDKKEISRFRKKINNLPASSSQKNRELMDGERKPAVFHNCTVAIFMALPFVTILLLNLIFLNLWDFVMICILGISLIIFIYAAFRHFLVNMDFSAYCLQSIQKKDPEIIVYENIYKIITGAVWLISATLFYTLLMWRILLGN